MTDGDAFQTAEWSLDSKGRKATKISRNENVIAIFVLPFFPD